MADRGGGGGGGGGGSDGKGTFRLEKAAPCRLPFLDRLLLLTVLVLQMLCFRTSHRACLHITLDLIQIAHGSHKNLKPADAVSHYCAHRIASAQSYARAPKWALHRNETE